MRMKVRNELPLLLPILALPRIIKVHQVLDVLFAPQEDGTSTVDVFGCNVEDSARSSGCYSAGLRFLVSMARIMPFGA